MRMVFIIAEIGINHNGEVGRAKQLIDVAVSAGCNAVKFQKRDIETSYTPEFLDSYRESPWGKTQREQKQALELSYDDYVEIDKYCDVKGIPWFASVWDNNSVEFIKKFNLAYNKIASLVLPNTEILKLIAAQKKYTFISTGASTIQEIDEAVRIFRDMGCMFELMHCNSTYPMKDEYANLSVIQSLKGTYCCDVGYSGHETGIQISLAAATLGATSIERHITLDRTMYGSYQSASLEPAGLAKLVRDIRIIEKAMGNGNKFITTEEQKVRDRYESYSLS